MTDITIHSTKEGNVTFTFGDIGVSAIFGEWSYTDNKQGHHRDKSRNVEIMLSSKDESVLDKLQKKYKKHSPERYNGYLLFSYVDISDYLKMLTNLI